MIKPDLAVRPVFHWTPRRIRARIAICHTAFALPRILMRRLRTEKAWADPCSEQAVLDEIGKIRASPVIDENDGAEQLLPSDPSRLQKAVHQTPKSAARFPATAEGTGLARKRITRPRAAGMKCSVSSRKRWHGINMSDSQAAELANWRERAAQPFDLRRRWRALIRTGCDSASGVHPLTRFGAWRASIAMSATSVCAHVRPMRNQIRRATSIV